MKKGRGTNSITSQRAENLNGGQARMGMLEWASTLPRNRAERRRDAREAAQEERRKRRGSK